MAGIGLRSLNLTNVGVYKDLKLSKLNKQGFVTICGINKDSHNVINNTNGVGKSLMFGALPTLLFEADPLALTKKSKTNMLKKGSMIEMEWDSPLGGKIKIEQHPSKYKVYLDGKDQEVERQDVARTWIKKHFPLSPEDFYSYVYIQTDIPHPFQRVKPVDRLKYLTSLFNLDVYDRIRAEVKKKLDAAKEAETESRGIADLLDVTERKQNALKVTPEMRKKIKSLGNKSDALKIELNELYEAFVSLSTLRKDAKRYTETKESIDELGVVSDDPKKELKKLRKQLEQHEDFEEYESELGDYKKKKKSLEAQIKDLPESQSDSKVLVKKHSKLVSEEEDLEELIIIVEDQHEQYSNYLRNVKELSKILKGLSKPKRTREEAEEVRGESRAIIRAYEKLCDHVEGTSCPTCGQDVDMKAMQRAAKKAKAAIEGAEQDIKYLDTKIELRALEQHAVKKPKYDKKELEKQLRKVAKQIDLVTEEFETEKKRNTLVTKLEALEKPEKVDAPKSSVKKINSRIEALEELSDLVQQLKAYKEPKKTFAQYDKEYISQDKKIKSMQAEIAEIDRETQKIGSMVQEYDHYDNTLVDMRTKLKKLQPLIDKRVVFETLYKAYSNNALKLRAIEGRLKSIEDNLNRYSSLVFPENFVFKLFSSKQGVEATVTRTESKSTTDISILSGAETSCFRLLWAISILPFIPANRRTNFMVLDEPDKGACPSVRDHLIENFLPILRSIVPNVYWVTPLEVEHFSDKQWTVTKENGTTTLSKKEI